jgi:8-oxo-dGTP pyrophosphatase MutT (NUDIX family)
MTKGAGILFISLNGNALFLKRGAKAVDCVGCWDFPGGGQESDETAEQTAVREAREEIGFLPEGTRVLHTRQRSSPSSSGVGAGGGGAALLPVSPTPPIALPVDVDYTTFTQRVTNEFTPELSDEHDGWAWAPLASPPEPLHPGCRIALDRLTMDELGVARAIADGRLTSPQRYENVTLFAVRVTGTDTAFRTKNGEFVYRNPELYLNDEFLARCNGLPVIFKHPKKTPLLTGEEFSNRVVGTVFLPYVAGTEVWAVVKIYIDEVAQMMEEGDLSTSPGVNFSDFSVNSKLTLMLYGAPTTVLIEGKPSLLDHVAICELGVWDKGGEPAGIRSESREDSAMTPEEEKAKKDADEKAAADKAKRDAEEAEKKAKEDAARKDAGEAGVGEKLDKVLSHLDSANTKLDAFGKRLDAVEMTDKARKDAEEKSAKEKEEAEKTAADKAKKDAEDKAKKDAEEAEKKAKEDAAKTDSASIQKRIDDVAAMIPKNIGDADYVAITDAQARADEAYAQFGLHAPRPLHGETPALYERRVVREMKKHSPTWKDADVSTAFADEASFAIVRDQVFAEAKKTALSPATAPEGGLRMITKRGASGHVINEFVGDPRSWMYPMSGAVRQYAQGRFNTGRLGNQQ